MKKEHILNENNNKIPYVSKIKEIKRTLGNKYEFFTYQPKPQYQSKFSRMDRNGRNWLKCIGIQN